MMTYWNNLNERERLLVIIGGICLFVFALYQLIYSPLSNSSLEKQREAQEKKETFAWMQQKRQIPLNTAVKPSVGGSKLLSIIGTQLNTKPFIKFPHQLQQTSLGLLQLSFDNVPYTPFLLWLWKLEHNYAFTVKQFDASRTKTAGVVKIMVLIDANA